MASASETTQLAIIGGGPGGYAAAFLAADLGLEVTLIDLEPNPGGVCLYRGCIPSKALLHVAKVINEAKEAHTWGVTFSDPKIDLDKIRSWKEQVVNRLTGGVGQLSKQRKINYIQGQAKFVTQKTLQIHGKNGDQQLNFKNAILATGSYPVRLPGSIESPKLLDSTSALELQNIPKNLLVVGGGYIGLEMATVYASLGSQVTVVEMGETLLPGADSDLVAILSKQIEKRVHRVLTKTKVAQMQEESQVIRVRFEGSTAGEEVFEKVLVAIGRKPNSAISGLEYTQVKINQQGFIQVDSQCRTNDPDIFAIGDVVGEPMLAHKASHEGRVAAEVIAGFKAVFEPRAIPAVVFTDPEVAWCGLTEAEANRKGQKIQVTRFPWAASGRAITLNRTDGLTKLIIDPETERVLGAGIVGPGAGELISELVLAVEMAAVASDIKLSIHPHPTLSETVMESAEVFFGQSTHVYRPIKK
ncbi:dihydrolipoyl dehydrogenase [Candidatus Nitrosacidococcus tergens]|uniref:Dihydrolipoyl dehydrogenase n=1 Tax=Candidatus Nitrosacidococcus tergens TaxID=553981 RepID=A0A7G1Q8R2_9GAMM|nr:dihydrolipoyl dehydrogenase [Candidatus Nitrosacidococcus tergens]CAB1275195.1 Pyruvate dehydrogenase complex, dihydrolipoamide dehydrogenase component E3 [Candidatus Nitrosacidococcus tergens]